MCGLFGSIGFPPEKSRIDIVAHRGPDGSGWEVHGSPAGPVSLGHRRLSIIDLSKAGHQPAADPAGRYRIVYNGEIYNYIEIRQVLQQMGERFSTASDTEVLLRAYVVWGERALDRLRGMFAFVIWDRREKRLFAARDRFGIKPLYFAQSSQGIAFASEIKQLLGLPPVSGRMNVARVHDFLASGISDHTSETMFDGVQQLRAGEYAVIDAGGGAALRADVRRWYSVEVAELRMSEAEAGEQLRQGLSEAIAMHLRSDVPVGTCLSGGLDSSAIVCLMADQLNSHRDGPQVNTVSACFAEKSVDEKPFMDAVVEHARALPRFVFPKADDVLDRAAQITWHQDEPFGSTSIFAQWCVFEEARRAGVKVMLDGQGADEPLAGYHHSFRHYIAWLARRGDIPMIARTMAERKKFHGVSLAQQFPEYISVFLPKRVLDWAYRQWIGGGRDAWLGSSIIREKGNLKGAHQLASELLDLPEIVDIRSLCLAQTHASNLQMLLHWEDRNSMAHSIEARVPFLDHPLVEFMLGLGNDHKIVGGDTKRVLRVAMAGILPDKVLQRRDKLGFATPEQIWFRGPLRGAIEDRIESTIWRYPDLMNARSVRTLVKDMLNGDRPLDFMLWRIVNLGIWGERFCITV
ncbi:MAG: asparagine synthase (glutamine-hydrolyzing) [Hyphomicrobiaceae bacterium]